MKKGHSKLSKNEPENIPLIKITYLLRDLKDYNWFLIESDSSTGKFVFLIFV